MADFSVTTIDLLRHGQPEGGEIFRGHSDVAISAQGLQQMHAAVLKEQGCWDRLLTSPLQRCQQFALEYAEQQGLACDVVEDLREISFGDWDGLSFEQVAASDAELFNNFWRDPVAYTPPSGELMLDFCGRIQSAFWSQLQACRGQHVLMVVHGGVIRAVLADILKAGPASLTRFEVPYASLTRIKVYEDDAGVFPQLVFHNR